MAAVATPPPPLEPSQPNTGILPPAEGWSAGIPCSAHRRWDNALEQPGLGHEVALAPTAGRFDSGAGRGGWGGQGAESRRHGNRGPTERFCDKGGAAAADPRSCRLPSAHGCRAGSGDEVWRDARDEHDATTATTAPVATGQTITAKVRSPRVGGRKPPARATIAEDDCPEPFSPEGRRPPRPWWSSWGVARTMGRRYR